MNKVKLLIVPFNYVLNPDITENIGLELRDKIIIFDEAHNIENAGEECCSH